VRLRQSSHYFCFRCPATLRPGALLRLTFLRLTPRFRADVPSGFFPGPIHYFAGTGVTTGTYSDGSVPTQVPLAPLSTVTDSKGNVYIATTGDAIYMVYAGGAVPAVLANVTTNATPSVTPEAGRIYQIGGLVSGQCGACEGMPLNQVGFSSIYGLAIDINDNLYYSDDENASQGTKADVVRRVDAATSNVTTVAGTWGVESTAATLGDGGPATSATLYNPEDIRFDQWGNLYINDYFDDLVRVVYSGSQPPPILAAENITVGPNQKNFIYTVAGQYFAVCSSTGTCGDGGPATSATMDYQWSIGVDQAGDLFIADASVDSSGTVDPYIRVVYAGGAVPPLLNLGLNPGGGNTVTPVNGYIYAVTGYSVTPEFAPCAASGCGDGGLAGTVQFGGSGSSANLLIAVDATGNLYVSDSYAHAVRKFDTSGYASTIAGIDNPTQSPPATIPVPDGGPAVGSYLNFPAYISFDSLDNLYLVDTDLLWRVVPLQPQTITFPTLSNVTYGAAPIALTATASSGLPVQYSVSSTPSGIAHVNGSDLVIAGAGTVHVTASQPGDSTYATAPPVTNSFTVVQAPLTVSADPASKVLGTPNPSFTATITGFVNGDTAQTPGVILGAPAFATTATTTSPQGTYPITVSIGTLTSADYSFPPANFIAGTLTVTGNVPQTINFPPFSPAAVPYGHAPITLSATATSGGPVTFIYVSGPGQLSGPNGSTLTITGAGTIVVKATQEGYQRYAAATPVSESLIVNPAVLTVTGPTVTTAYGIALDPTTFPNAIISGFVGADTASSTLTGSAQYTIPSATPNAGTYPISVSLGTLALVPAAAPNYVFATPVNGTLIVNQATQVINFNPIPAGQTYGQFINLTAAATSGLPVAFTTTGPSIFYNNINNEIELSGVGTVTVSATQAGNGNYLAATTVTQTFNVGPAPLQVLAKPFTREQGAPNPTFTYTIGCPPPLPGCFVLNDTDIPSVITGIPSVTTTATDASSPGTYPIVISQGTLSAPNYTFVYVNSTLTVTPPGAFSITANPSSLTIPRGFNAQSTITITPNNFYQGTVTLSCGQLPVNVSCVVSPATFTFTGATANGSEGFPAQGTITINTTAGTIVGAVAGRNSSTSLAGLLMPGAFFGLLLLFVRRRAAKWLGAGRACLLMLLGLGLFSLVSCGGHPSLVTAAPGTITFSINGSGTTPSGSGSVTASAPLTVVIQ
jgi:MBG domain (YGX type)